MYRSNKTAFFNIHYLIADIMGLLISYCTSYIVASQFTHLYGLSEYLWLIAIYLPVWIFIMIIGGMYNDTTFNYYDKIFKYIVYSTICSSSLIATLMVAIKETMYSRTLIFSFFIITFVIMIVEKYIFSYLIKLPDNEGSKQVIVIGVKSMYDQFNYYVTKTNIKINVVKYITVDGNEDLDDIALDKETFQKYLKEQVVDEVFFALPIEYINEIQEYALISEEMGITSRVLLDLIDTKFSKIHVTSIGKLPMISFHSVSLNILQLFTKRIIDIVGALLGLVLTSFIWIIASVAIKLDSKGPIIYAQDRVGRNGRIFKLYKFRSMSIDAEKMKKELLNQNELSNDLMFKMKDDPRITRVGNFIRKTSIDEFPQFLNVLKGDMSLVGTRPPTVDEVSKYESYHYRRISIKPGITGMWQVSGRNSITDFDEVVNLDTMYIDKWSIMLDFKIMIKTVGVVVFKIGAY